MGIIVDLIIIAILVLSTFLAYRKGLVKLAINLCAFVIAIVATFILYQPISNFVINATGIDEAIEDAIYEKANDIINQNSNDNKTEIEITNVVKEDMLPKTAKNLSTNIVTGGVIIVLYIIIKIILKFVTALTDLITKLPIINQFNKVGGIIYGILRGIIIIYLGLLLLSIPGKINPNNKINSSVNSSYIGKIMYEYNILNTFFK